VDHPSEAPEPSEPSFVIDKQRGIFDGNYFHALDNTPDCTDSDVVSARLKKDGTFGYKATTDVADTSEFTALLDHVRQQIAHLADQILAGAIDIAPYRMGTTSPCPHCRYRSICRFDPTINRYRHIPPARREEVLKRVVEEASHGA
jgi:ATP-dependent helicase/nuclease subunit B